MKDKAKANLQQRKRVERLNKGFDDLRRVLRIDMDTSKIWTLTKASKYIDQLTRLLNESTSYEKNCESGEITKFEVQEFQCPERLHHHN
ncbi:protein atonal homolog 7-B-like [Actinia tenebrosa]|uniref:Protein atonal homolog 7-B-like n=1 Tax=Actinia tenebrosa TaxID=6105 RepID=A0A6P8H148_ACTTE|nr:protein atonal homolog 7-B-like [Actinia tenebrosa]